MIVRRGDIGDEVIGIQELLNRKGFDLVADGIFGPSTEAAVANFQSREGLQVDGIVGNATIAALKTTSLQHDPDLIERVESLGHTVYRDGQINTIGVRTPEINAGQFDDEIHLIWKNDDEWHHETFPATTDPGAFYLRNPLHVDGTAILVPGQYRVYKFAKHQGKYTTLCQRGGPVRVWRDDNQDGVLDWGGEEHEGWYGINIHHGGSNNPKVVARWSAGCQVFATMSDWKKAMKIWRSSGESLFTYTLILA